MQRVLRWFLPGAILIGTFAFTACSDIVDSVTNGKKDAPFTTIPIDWTLTDSLGRSIDVTIIGREPDSITFIRRSDGKRFDLAFNRLSKSDQIRASKLPIQPAPRSSGALKFRTAKLSELDAEIQRIMDEMRLTSSPTKHRSLNSALDRLRSERSKLLAEIAELERR